VRIPAPSPLSRTATWASAGIGAASLGVFFKLSQELLWSNGTGSWLNGADQGAIAFVLRVRSPSLTRTAIEVTALGTPTVLGALVIVAAIALRLSRDRLGAMLLGACAAGAIGWTSLLKNLIERERPPLGVRLVGTSGFSYPSGHSLASASVLAALALIVARHVRWRSQQVLTFAVTAVAIVAVAASRVYLGVHYLSDVAAGTSFGLAWAFATVAVLSAIHGRHQV
jgi:undecaprenyl-diphosphatase